MDGSTGLHLTGGTRSSIILLLGGKTTQRNGVSPNLVMAPLLGSGIISVQIRVLRLPVSSLAHLTKYNPNLIILRQQFKTMSLIQKFKKDVSTLRSAANGEFYLDVKSPKLYKKVRRFYENEGVVFSGDPLDDYEMLMDYIAQDLESIEVA